MVRHVPTQRGKYYNGVVISDPVRPTMWVVGVHPWKASIYRANDGTVIVDEKFFDNYRKDDAVAWMKTRVHELDDAMRRRLAPYEEAND